METIAINTMIPDDKNLGEQSEPPTLTELQSQTLEEQQIKALADQTIKAVASKYSKAKKEAFVSQAKRVSRRLLLSLRAQKLTCVCPFTGIVSLLEVPAVPGFALTYTHPLSSLANCRGIAQRGIEYLRKLDTQTLAGILIVLADSYSLIRFDPDASGARKNAILRTAGKNTLIDAILIIEFQIHSRNINSVPHLSLTQGAYSEDEGIRLHNYLALLTEAIRTPDLSEYDENVPPKKIGRPVYIRDVEEKERKLSYLARQEISAAKKVLESDAKTAILLASNLVSTEVAKPGLKPFIKQLFADKGMALLEVDQSLVDMLINQKLSGMNHSDAVSLIEILRKDRKILKKEITEEDDPVPGMEEAIEDSAEQSEAMDSPELQNESEETSNEEQQNNEETPEPPAGLTLIGKVLWRKKYQADRMAHSPKNNFEQSSVPSVHTYTPSADKEKLGKD